jgi:nucleoside-diphosphate-sugar epimerase
MRILVLGGTHFIGLHTVRRLVALGHDVTLFHRGEHEPEELAGLRHIHGDRERIGDFAREFARLKPDVALDIRAMTESDATSAIAALRGATPRAVCVSSVDVYRAYGRLHGSEPGPIEPMPLTEDSPLRERLYPYRGERKDASFDAYDKIPVERAYLHAPEVVSTIVRLPAVYGEGDFQYRFWMAQQRFDARRPSILVQEEEFGWRWPRAYAGNVAQAIAVAATDERTGGRIYNAPNDAPLTQGEWYREYARIEGWDGEVIALPDEYLPPHLKQANNYKQDLVVDGTRMRKELGYEDVVPLDDGVRRAFEWTRENPPAKFNPRMLDFSLEDAALAAYREATAAS